MEVIEESESKSELVFQQEFQDRVPLDQLINTQQNAENNNNNDNNNTQDSETPQFPTHRDIDNLVEKSAPTDKNQFRRVVVPFRRIGPLKENWLQIYTPIVKNLKLQIRYNTKNRKVELKPSSQTTDLAHLQRACDFLQAFMLGFSIEDALALLRIDGLYVESFNIDDVKPLHGEHLARAIGRVAGKDGKTKFSIENASRTRICLVDKKVHILGSWMNIRSARSAICDLVLGSPPSKVYGKLRIIASKTKERF